jgi:MTH538 TIR-like domain (DUF1863)
MPFSDADTYDVFITHAWRYHDDWNRIAEVLNRVAGFKWRNFSVPWYDPAMDPNTAVGGQFVRNWLESQILPCHAVLFLDSVYAVRSARKWLDTEIEMARAAGKPIIALPAFGAAGVDAAVASKADAVMVWDGVAVARAIASLAPVAAS